MGTEVGPDVGPPTKHVHGAKSSTCIVSLAHNYVRKSERARRARIYLRILLHTNCSPSELRNSSSAVQVGIVTAYKWIKSIRLLYTIPIQTHIFQRVYDFFATGASAAAGYRGSMRFSPCCANTLGRPACELYERGETVDSCKPTCRLAGCSHRVFSLWSA